MSGFLAHFIISCRLHLRNRMALIYGYLFPLIFLGAFWVLYRHESIPLFRHVGELLTVTILGGACFGLPTTLVSERERGVWRRYRLTPIPPWSLIASTVAARYFIILSAGLLQLSVAFSVGLPAPGHPVLLFVAFSVAALAFIGLGLVLAALADTVPAVQALGQCIFLPMLVIGGVAVPLAGLPEWAQQLAGFLPGRYAVESMQAAMMKPDYDNLSFGLLALTVTGIAGAVAGTKLFRWDAQQRFAWWADKGWLWAVLMAWLAVGGMALVVDYSPKAIAMTATTGAEPFVAKPRAPWEKITDAEVATLDFDVPPDRGVYTPFAAASDVPDDFVAEKINYLSARLADWPLGAVGDDLQRVRYLLCVAAVPDVTQEPSERFIPVVVLEHLTATFPKKKLIQMLTWIALHPDEGTVVGNISALGMPRVVGDLRQVRERSHYYAIKCVMRLTDRKSR